MKSIPKMLSFKSSTTVTGCTNFLPYTVKDNTQYIDFSLEIKSFIQLDFQIILYQSFEESDQIIHEIFIIKPSYYYIVHVAT